MNTNLKCDVCKHLIWVDRPNDMMGCSEFCATVSQAEKDAFLKLQVDEWGVWPCSECGQPVEGEYQPGAHCSTCHPKVQLRERTALLREALAHLPDELATRVRAALGSDLAEEQPTE